MNIFLLAVLVMLPSGALARERPKPNERRIAPVYDEFPAETREFAALAQKRREAMDAVMRDEGKSKEEKSESVRAISADYLKKKRELLKRVVRGRGKK